MSRILIVYGTTEGHTRKIAEQIGTWIRDRGMIADLLDSANLTHDFLLELYDGFIVAGSLHETKHQRSLTHFVKAHREELKRKPSAFLSASLTAAIQDAEHSHAAHKCMDTFYEDTDWHPTVETPVAGALLYTQYDFLKRFLLKMISKSQGGDTDTSKDYEYTDWVRLKGFIDGFLDQHVAKGHQALVQHG